MKKLAMVFVFMPLMALAETWKEPDTGISWSYIVTNGTAMVTSVTGGSEVVIPSTLNGYRVSSIGTRAFSRCSALKNVTIPSSVTSIGVCAFADCAELTSVTIPEGVVNIDHGAFLKCGALKSVTIPSSVTNIESSAFMMCESMTTISVALNNEMYTSSDGVLYDKLKTELIRCPAGIDGEVVIPDGVTRVGSFAFHSCKGVTSVTIPDSVMNIGTHAFFRCGGLRSVTIPSSVTNIEFAAFAQCGGLTSVMIPSSVTGIEDGAFSNCENLKTVDVFSGDEVERLSFDEFFKRQREMKKARFMEEFGRKRAQKGHVIRAGSDSDSASIATGKRVVESTGTSIKREDFKAELTGVAIIEGGRMCGFESRAQKADFQSPDRLIEVPYGKAACFRVEYDFPEGYQARVWTRDRWQNGEDGSSYYFGSNPSPLYKGKGVAYGFLDMLKRGKTCTLKRLAIRTNSQPKIEGLSREWDIAVTTVNIKFYGPETVQNTAAEDVASAVTNNTVNAEKVSVAEKLEMCDFLLNKNFKKNAKYYLCLFSASWCPPCRREMPRIAKTYAETLKDDPDIELIHFSRDQDDDKALAWAKEHDVKFPVVKPKGGNPLDLKTSGIPHLFILKADGTLVEQDHPMRIFNEEKFKEIKGGVAMVSKRSKSVGERKDGTEEVDGVKWNYKIVDGEAVLSGRAVSKDVSGALVIPEALGGFPVRRIEDMAFRYCTKLTSVTIPACVTNIKGNPFDGCCGIESFVVSSDNPMYSSVDGLLCSKDGKTLIAGLKGDLKIPDGVTNIGAGAFYACWKLKSVTIPPSVTNIALCAFYMSGLTSVTIPEGVISIGDSAFGDCSGITSVAVPSSVISIGHRAFSVCSGRLNSISVSPTNAKYASVNGLLCSKDGKSVIAGIDGDVTIPEGVASVDDWAFYKCRGLMTVTIPASVTKIGKSAFEWCDKVKIFSVSSANSKYSSPNGLLCTKDGKILLAGVNGEVVIPDGVTTISELAFSSRNELTSVAIPSSVRIVGEEAFRCCRGLTSVKMLGERPTASARVFDYCGKLKEIHVPANAKSWAGMKEWQGIPLVFD